MMWCFSPVKLWLEINYNHSGRAKSCWFKQPLFWAISHLVLPSLPPPQIRAGIGDQNFLKLLDFCICKAKSSETVSKSLPATEWEAYLFVHSHTGKSLFYHFHTVSQSLRPEGVIRLSNLTCCELRVIASYFNSPRWLWQVTLNSSIHLLRQPNCWEIEAVNRRNGDKINIWGSCSGRERTRNAGYDQVSTRFSVPALQRKPKSKWKN